MLKLPKGSVIRSEYRRDAHVYGHGRDIRIVTCKFCVPLGSPLIPQGGEEIEIEDDLFQVIRIGLEQHGWAAHTSVELECSFVQHLPVFSEFVYDRTLLVERIREIFRRKKFAI